MINKYISELIDYSLKAGIIEKEDAIFCQNRLLEALWLYSYIEEDTAEIPLNLILDGISDFAVENKLIENTASSVESFQNYIMNLVMPRPSEIKRRFDEEYKASPAKATNYFYKLCQDADYIKTYRISKDVKWLSETEYGELQITINLSKPEKDPRDIAAAKNAPSINYPKCLLCPENEGYSGTQTHPSRQNHRIINIKLCGEDWGMQYSPYLYYNEHSIILNKKHLPMTIERATFQKLIDFLKQFPHYFIGSNADLPIVGGSILSHEHFQGGRHTFPLETASIIYDFKTSNYPNIKAGIVKWPMSVIRISSRNADELVDFAVYILEKWRGYSDAEAGIYAFSGETPHNTITPIARYCDGIYTFDLVLRNNITTKEHPMGVFHPHKELHNIKKDNIGLIEVMGLAILPPRLLSEMEQIKAAILESTDIPKIHADWVKSWVSHHKITPDNVDEILKNEIAKVFEEVLHHAGVYKCDENGQQAFIKFISTELR